MKYLIIGTGGTGSSIGGFLALQNHDVTFISRGDSLKAFQENGLILKSTIKGDQVITNINFVSEADYSDQADVIFVCVKSYSVDQIIPLLKKACHENTVIIPIMNGYHMSALITKHFNHDRVIDGCMYISAFVEAPGRVVQLGNLFRVVYGLRKDQRFDIEVLETVKEHLTQSGIETIFSDNIERDTFRKFTFISSCATCGAYFDVPVGHMQEESEYRTTFISLCKEIESLGKALGVEMDYDVVEVNLNILHSLTPDTTASLQKDLKAGRKTEIDECVFKVVKLGQELGLDLSTYKKISSHFGFNIKA